MDCTPPTAEPLTTALAALLLPFETLDHEGQPTVLFAGSADDLARLLAPGVRVSPDEGRLDVERLRKAFIAAGIVWVLPADLFQESVEVVAREYARLATEEQGHG